ncbi:hypothetical protein FDECE_2381 [Fusarium decemcellulare]|nr:hypothetical protein FDECE_2381 [Fusarium decemcellulare]
MSTEKEKQVDSHPDDTTQRTHQDASPEYRPDIGLGDTKPINNNAQGGVFGGDNGENYRTMSRTNALMALLSNQFGIGILSVPGTLKTLGLIPGLIFIIGMGPVAWYGGYLLYEFVCRYRHVSHIADIMYIVGGRYWGGIVGTFFVILVVSTSSSVVVTMSIALNTITDHSVCTVGYIGIACLMCWLICVPRTAKFVAQTGIPTCLSIVAAILTVMISLGVDGPQQAPEGWVRKIELVKSPPFRDGFTACLRVIFAYAGHFSFVSFMAEMRDPEKDFPFALTGLYCCSTVLFTTVGAVIYCLAGEYTTSPALGSASALSAKIAYGLAIPAIITGGLGAGHVGIKYVYIHVMQWMKSADQITANTSKSWSVWLSCVTVFWILTFIIASSVPVFDSIISVCSATTFAWFSYGLGNLAWFHLYQGHLFDNWRRIIFCCINVGLLMFTLLINSAGLWASITELLDIFNDPDASVRGAFDCGDNSL